MSGLPSKEILPYMMPLLLICRMSRLPLKVVLPSMISLLPSMIPLQLLLAFTCSTCFCQTQRNVVVVSSVAGRATQATQTIVVGLFTPTKPKVAGYARSVIVNKHKPWCLNSNVPDSSRQGCLDLLAEVFTIQGEYVVSTPVERSSTKTLCLSPLPTLALGHYFIRIKACSKEILNAMILVVDDG